MSKRLIKDLSQRYIDVYKKLTGKKYKKAVYPIEKRILKNIDPYIKIDKRITYEQVGDNYETKDPIKKLFQEGAKSTAKNLLKSGFVEVSDSRGESAYVWKQGSYYMASVVEGLGTKNLIADDTRKITKKTYYDVVAHDTVATIINDLVTVGAKPLVVHAYWAIEDNGWLYDVPKMRDLIKGWGQACDLAGASWGGGETATMKQIVVKNVAEFAGSAIGFIKNKKRLTTDKKLKNGDRMIFLKSNGVNANGISLTRAIAKKLPKGYATKLPGGKRYGEALLTKTNIYAKVVQNLLDAGVDIHYIANITGHGLRKIMRARQSFTYIVEKIFKPQEVFLFIQKHANLDDYMMYQTYNMGQDYALFLPKKDVAKTLRIIKKNKFKGIDAGYLKKGKRQVILQTKNIVFKSETMDLR
jgi:phosphoribosylformylglycinamidine cyclo-ligase